MEKEEIIDVIPLMDGQIADRRREIKREIVKYTLFSSNLGNAFTVSELVSQVLTKTGVDIVDSVVIDCLDVLEEEELVRHVRENKYEVTDGESQKNFSDLIEPIWFEFWNKVKSSKYDEQIDYDEENYRGAFEEFFREFFDKSLDIINSSDDSDDEFSKDPLETNNIGSIIDDISERKNLKNESIFEDLLKLYIDNRSDLLLEFVGDVYIAAVNYDILSKEQKIDLNNEPDDSKKLILDTNILIALLCPTDKLHPLASTICDRSNGMKYDLHYINDTVEELQGVIKKTKRQLTRDNIPTHKSGKYTQFTRDYLNRDDVINPSAYELEMKRWKNTLEEEWNITEYEGDLQIEESEFELIKSWVKSEDQREGNGRKTVSQINHDASLISFAAKLRDDTDDTSLAGPFVISNNSSLFYLNKYGEGSLWTQGIVMQPRGWLNYLLAFTPAGFSKSDKTEVAEAVLNTASNFEQRLSLDEYIELLASRTNMSGKNKEYLEDIVTQMPIAKEFQDAIERGDYEKAEEFEQELKENFTDLVEEYTKKSEKLKSAAKTANRRAKEAKIEKERRKQLERQLEEINSINIDNSVSVNQSTEVSFNQETHQHIEKFITDVRSKVGNDFSDSEIPEPPEDTSNASKVVDWLDRVDSIMQNTSDISSELKSLKPALKGLMLMIGM